MRRSIRRIHLVALSHTHVYVLARLGFVSPGVSLTDDVLVLSRWPLKKAASSLALFTLLFIVVYCSVAGLARFGPSSGDGPSRVRIGTTFKLVMEAHINAAWFDTRGQKCQWKDTTSFHRVTGHYEAVQGRDWIDWPTVELKGDRIHGHTPETKPAWACCVYINPLYPLLAFSQSNLQWFSLRSRSGLGVLLKERGDRTQNLLRVKYPNNSLYCSPPQELHSHWLHH